MTLSPIEPDVSHVDAHNDERTAINDLREAIEGVPNAYASKQKLRVGTLLSRFKELSFVVAPSDNVATVTHQDSAYTITSGFYTALPGLGPITEVGSRGAFIDAQQKLQVAGTGEVPGVDFYLDGDTVELAFIGQSNITSIPWWIFVDGQPMTATYQSLAVTSATLHTVKLVFPTQKKRRVEIFSRYLNGWYAARATYANLISPAPRRPRVVFVGDSYWAGSTYAINLESAAFYMSRLLGVECCNAALGGTGYVGAGSFNTFGSSARRAMIAAFDPELILVQGSVNDNVLTGRQAAATAFYSALAGAHPGVPVIVWGAQPTADDVTVGAAQSGNIADIKAAALAASNVIAFHDMVGTAAGVPPTWASTGQTYNLGDLTVYQGAIYKWVSPVAGNATNPGVSPKWALVSYALTGTGRVGATAANGTRDLFLGNDDVHPMPAANVAFGLRQVEQIQNDLRVFALV